MDLPRQGRHGLNGPGTPCSFHDLLHFHLTVACVEAENPPVEAVVTDRLHNADDVGVDTPPVQRCRRSLPLVRLDVVRLDDRWFRLRHRIDSDCETAVEGVAADSVAESPRCSPVVAPVVPPEIAAVADHRGRDAPLGSPFPAGSLEAKNRWLLATNRQWPRAGIAIPHRSCDRGVPAP